MFLTRASLVVLLLAGSTALAQRQTTRDALERMEESLAMRSEDGSGLAIKDLVPVMVVSTKPAFEESKAWFPAAALGALVRVFGGAALRSCEACQAPRLRVEDGRFEQTTGELTTAEIIHLDGTVRGESASAKAAVWLDETADGVAIKIVDLRNSRIVMAENFDPLLTANARTRTNIKLAREYERRQRGDALSHTFIDFAFLPGQHISLDWTEQWGADNNNLSGFTASLFDPVLGFGAVYYRVIPIAWNLMVGLKVLFSVPTALVAAVSGQSTPVIDPLFNVGLVIRLPIASSNFAACFIATTNGRIGFGISLLNFSLLPFLP